MWLVSFSVLSLKGWSIVYGLKGWVRIVRFSCDKEKLQESYILFCAETLSLSLNTLFFKILSSPRNHHYRTLNFGVVEKKSSFFLPLMVVDWP